MGRAGLGSRVGPADCPKHSIELGAQQPRQLGVGQRREAVGARAADEADECERRLGVRAHGLGGGCEPDLGG
eukprot:scaffold11812_cov134-Isochrysis_galbana.AAC.2